MSKATRLSGSLLALLLTASAVSASDLVITNARLFDAVDGEVRDNVTIRINDGVIEAIGSEEHAEEGDLVIDAQGRTVMPGLINGHLHQFFDFYNPPGYVVSSDTEARDYIERVAELLKGHLEHGFTTVFSPIDFWPEILKVRDALASGEMVGPRLLIAGGILVHPGGHYACAALQEPNKAWCEEHISKVVDSPESAREAVRFYAEGNIDAISYDALTNSPGLQPDVVQALTDEASKLGLRVLVHNSDAADAAGLVEAGVAGFSHVPGQTHDADGSLLAPVGAAGVPVVMPIAVGRQQETKDNAIALLEAGAVPIFASDLPGIGPEEVLPQETELLSSIGLSNVEILLAATRDAANAYLGRDDLGTIEVGKIADLIIVDGDPVNDIGALSNVDIVIQEGDVVFGTP